MKDALGRDIEYMRISITDRCNLRCRYCMPEEGIEKISMSSILSYQDIVRICTQAVRLGISRFKVTGGEPLVRRGCTDLIAEMKKIPGVEQVTLTTNGQLLKEHLDDLEKAGIDGINVSLDSLDEKRYRMITRVGELAPVLAGIDAALQRGLPTKVNCLIQKGINEDEIMDFAGMAFEKEMEVRFIETMPVGFADADRGVSNEDILLLLRREWPHLEPDKRIHGNGPAKYYRLPGKKGAIGLISALHGKFCGECNRIRITSQGMIKPCLCYDESMDLLNTVREGSDEELKEAIEEAIMAKPAGHCFEEGPATEERSMVEIGG